ncbi:head-tail connector protein [Glaesserella sp.]|uniref:head-tail connector protein n=1 Tax=Glaesserella sp. TaxID=2094731 RepID=UPI0035A01262
MKITLDEIKQQCRIEHDLEDDLLLGYLKSAQVIVENYTNRKLFDTLPDNPPDNALLLSDDLKIAILMLIAYLYEHREGWNESNQMQFVGTILKLPPTVELIVSRYIFFTL